MFKSRIAVLVLVIIFSAPSTICFAGGENASERFMLKRQGCEWTQEMGEYIYACVKKHEGFNSHWCFNETIALHCPVNDIESTLTEG